MDRNFKILLVEDNPGGLLLMEDVFESLSIPVDLSTVSSGDLVVDSCRNSEPDLILMDLNLPVIGGKDVLKSLKADDDLKHVPVIVLSCSDAERDIRDVYGLYANAYMVKPMSLSDLRSSMEALIQFWAKNVKLFHG